MRLCLSTLSFQNTLFLVSWHIFLHQDRLSDLSHRSSKYYMRQHLQVILNVIKILLQLFFTNWRSFSPDVCCNCFCESIAFHETWSQIIIWNIFYEFSYCSFLFCKRCCYHHSNVQFTKGKPQSHNVATRDGKNSSSTLLNTAGAPTDFVWMFLSLFWIVPRGIPYCFMLYLWIKHPT